VSAPRVAVRAVVVVRGRVLLVNAYPGDVSDLWVPPGGGAEAGVGLHENLVREVREETGLAIRPGRLLGLSEFHNPDTGFHQVDLLFRARLAGAEEALLADPAGVVNRLRWASEDELASLRVKPDILRRVAFGPRRALVHEALDVMVP
jgi:ADP-ribose pyrophosphatase YjhB (NUDIX family)